MLIKLQDLVPVYDEEIKVRAMMAVNEMIIDGKSREFILEELKTIKDKVRFKEVSIDEVPINQVFPQVVQENQKELAEVLKIHRDIGLVSEQTASERAGYNWQQELTRGLKNKEDKEDGDNKQDKGINTED